MGTYGSFCVGNFNFQTILPLQSSKNCIFIQVIRQLKLVLVFVHVAAISIERCRTSSNCGVRAKRHANDRVKNGVWCDKSANRKIKLG